MSLQTASPFGEPVLELRALHKSFGETRIIRGVDLTVLRGQRHALIGPNGAGKSTLFNLISGHYTPSSGEILLNGASIAGFAPHIINRLGLSRSFQITNVFPRMTVAENLRISIMGRYGHRLTLFRPIRGLADVNDEVEEYLQKLRLVRRRDSLAGDLAYSEQRILEMGMALATDPAVLILDEPTAHLDAASTRAFVDDLAAGAREASVLLITHSPIGLEEFDEVLLLEHGRVAARGPHEELMSDARYRALLGLG